MLWKRRRVVFELETQSVLRIREEEEEERFRLRRFKNLRVAKLEIYRLC